MRSHAADLEIKHNRGRASASCSPISTSSLPLLRLRIGGLSNSFYRSLGRLSLFIIRALPGRDVLSSPRTSLILSYRWIGITGI
uniref:Uncharacterized protein n=1 Tax=Knipowitschia caucasica TaxID=637954 RepID=A0AAV2MJH1_KNICA